MRLLFELSGEHPALPAAEAEAVAVAVDSGTRRFLSEPGLLGLELPRRHDFPLERLAYTHAIHRHLFSCPLDVAQEMLGAVRLGEGTVRLRVKGLGGALRGPQKVALERKLGGVLGEGHRIDLTRPDIRVRLFVSEKAHAGVTLFEQDKRAIEGRRPVRRPFFSPVTLHPKLARALVNLSRVPNGGRVLDPFCGTGGILIEAGLMGMRVAGSDIEWTMVEGARQNLQHYGMTDLRLFQSDIGEVPLSIGELEVDAVVTDAPYGRASGTRGEKVAGIYGRLFRTASSLLGSGKRMVLAVHDPALVPAHPDFRLVQAFEARVHRSLTRHLMVFEKR
ncbi:MAG: methyltransferase domain-containing protein [Euryarchaeota archaeon]|nr:methyltransferase domain-containing protein [Euryarchaeota archaeon]